MSTWQTYLRELRAEFLSFTRTDLYCVLVRGPLGFKDFLTPPVGLSRPSRDEFRRDSIPIISISNTEGPPSLGSGCRLKPILFGNDRALFTEFQKLSREAARYVSRGSRTLVADSVPFEWWVNRVAELALEKRPDSPLAADAIRYPSLTNPGDFRPSTDEDPAALAKESHYIILPSNGFRCSVWAIDLILQDAEVSPSSTSKPIPPLDTALSLVPKQASSPEAKSGKKATHKRDEGKHDKCVGVYLNYLERKETPPGATAIAREAGCHPSTASRAIKKWEDKRKEMAKEDERTRRLLHNDEKD